MSIYSSVYISYKYVLFYCLKLTNNKKTMQYFFTRLLSIFKDFLYFQKHLSYTPVETTVLRELI